MGAGVGGSRGPAEQCDAVDAGRLERGPRGQARGRPGERVLVQVGDGNGEDELLAEDGHFVAHTGQDGRRVVGEGRQDELLLPRERRAGIAVARVGREDRDGVVAAVGERWGGVEGGRAVAVVGEGGEGGQALSRQGQRVGVGVGGRQRQVEALACLDGLVGDRGHDGHGIGVADGDVHGRGVGGGGAGAVAVVGDGEGDGIGTRLEVAGRPAEVLRLGVERGALGQRGVCPREGGGDARAVHRAVGQQQRRPDRVVGVVGRDADDEPLPLVDGPFVEPAELDGSVDVEHLEHQGGCRGGLAVARGELDGVAAVLVVVGRPREDARVGVEDCAGRHARGAERDGVSVHVGRREDELEGVVLLDRAGHERGEPRGLVDVGDEDLEGLRHLGDAVAGEDGDARVAAGRQAVGQPPQGLGVRVEHRPCGQVVGPVVQRVTIGIEPRDGHFDPLPLAHLLVGDGHQDGGRVHAGDGHGPPLVGEAAALVVGPHPEGGLGRAARRRRPGQQPRGRVHGRTGGAGHQRVGQRRAFGVGGLNGIAIGHVGLCRVAWRRGDGGPLVGRDAAHHTGREVEHLGIGVRKRQGAGRRGLAGQQHGIGAGGQVGERVAVGSDAVGVEQRRTRPAQALEDQPHRRQQAVGQRVRHRGVERHRARAAVHPRGRELRRDLRRQVGQHRELPAVGRLEAHPRVAVDRGRDLDLVGVGRQRPEPQGHRASRLVVGRRPDVDRLARRGVGEHVVGRAGR